MLERPADEWKYRIGWRFGRHVHIGVQAVQYAKASEREVAEHVLGDERRSQKQQQVGRHDRQRDRTARQHLCGKQHGGVARTHHERQRLEARGADPESEAMQGTG